MGVKLNKKEDKSFYTVTGFEDKSIRHIFTTKIGWDQEDIFKDIAHVFGVERKDVYCGKQVHGTDILVLANEKVESQAKENLEFDGFITNIRGKVLTTYHADCVPIYFYDKENKAIGLAHAGWRGSLNNICKNIIEKMKVNYKSKASDIVVAIGPSIGQGCYEISRDLAGIFLGKYEDESIIKDDNDKVYLDLLKVNKINLTKSGILEKNIYSADLCTSCEKETLYSYRGENKTRNRMVAGIMIL